MIDAPIVRDRGERYRVTVRSDRLGQPARTRYRVLSTARSDGFSHQPASGVATASLRSRASPQASTSSGARPVPGLQPTGGHAGDRAQPPDSRAPGPHRHTGGRDVAVAPPGRPAPRLCLHAHQLTLPHPATGAADDFHGATASALFAAFPAGTRRWRRLRLPGAHPESAAHGAVRAARAARLAVARRARWPPTRKRRFTGCFHAAARRSTGSDRRPLRRRALCRPL